MVVEELTTLSLTQAFADPSIVDIEPNCILKLDDETEFNQSITFNDNLPWGIDRVDSRSGTDGAYNVGSEKGAGSRVYVLDTGVRISHREFGGRAVPGWSAGCPTGIESSCSGIWVHRGVITSSRSSCSAHGTHCAYSGWHQLRRGARHDDRGRTSPLLRGLGLDVGRHRRNRVGRGRCRQLP